MAKHGKIKQPTRKKTGQHTQTNKLWGPILSSGGTGPSTSELSWRSVYFADTGIIMITIDNGVIITIIIDIVIICHCH
eukprot:5436147-Lingulodinium_polyedra.AAC.1